MGHWASGQVTRQTSTCPDLGSMLCQETNMFYEDKSYIKYHKYHKLKETVKLTKCNCNWNNPTFDLVVNLRGFFLQKIYFISVEG